MLNWYISWFLFFFLLLNRLKWSNVWKEILSYSIWASHQFPNIFFAFFGSLDFSNFAFDFHKRISAIRLLHKGGFLPPNRSKTHIKGKKRKKKKKTTPCSWFSTKEKRKKKERRDPWHRARLTADLF